MSDTPRTDSAFKEIENKFGASAALSYMADHSASIERELAESQAREAALREALDSTVTHSRNILYNQNGSAMLNAGQIESEALSALSQPAPPVVSKAKYDELWQHAEALYLSLEEYSRPVRTASDGGDHWCLIRKDYDKAKAMVGRIEAALAAHEALKKSK